VSTLGERSGDQAIYAEVQSSSRFTELRGRFRRFVFPMSVAFLAWYLAYVLLATYAPTFMATKVAGNITVGLIVGLSQFVTTFLITMIYVRFANRRLDPVAEELCAEIEGSGR
jgi:uncharacterized membrane protein (DUF485 family)